MKEIIFIIALCFAASGLKAQTEAETLEWLNLQKSEIDEIRSYSDGLDIGPWLTDNPRQQVHPAINFTSKGMVFFYKTDFSRITHPDLIGYANYRVEIAWTDIYEVKPQQNTYGLNIKFRSTAQYKEREAIIDPGTKEMQSRFMKALKHMATLKGAKMVNDDLFSN